MNNSHEVLLKQNNVYIALVEKKKMQWTKGYYVAAKRTMVIIGGDKGTAEAHPVIKRHRGAKTGGSKGSLLNIYSQSQWYVLYKLSSTQKVTLIPQPMWEAFKLSTPNVIATLKMPPALEWGWRSLLPTLLPPIFFMCCLLLHFIYIYNTAHGCQITLNRDQQPPMQSRIRAMCVCGN